MATLFQTRNFGPIHLRAGGFQFLGGARYFGGTGAPVDGTSGTGAGLAAVGSMYLRSTTGISYVNIGTKASPVWLTSGGALASVTKFCTTQFDAVTGTTGTTLTPVVGLTGFNVAAAGVYQFSVHVAGVSTANCGMKLGLKYTTATMTSVEVMARGYTASAVAVQHSTTATDLASFFAQTAVVINVTISGQLIVNAAGTIGLSAAQNVAHADTTSVYAGSYMSLTRIS